MPLHFKSLIAYPLLCFCLWIFIPPRHFSSNHNPPRGDNNQSPAGESSGSPAERELKQGVCAFLAQDYVKAQQRFEKALELDPARKIIPVLIARAIRGQYRENDDSPENVERARAAIAAYMGILAKDPGNREAFYEVAALYEGIKQDDKSREMLMKFAALDTVTRQERANTYTWLSSKAFQCAFGMTSQGENQQVVEKGGQQILRYKKPRNAADFERARDCARYGLQMAEQALSLERGYQDAHLYKSLLLREMAKLEEMDDNAADAASYNRQADEARLAYDKARQEALTKPEPTTEGTIEEPAKGSGKSLTEEISEFIRTGSYRREPKIDLGKLVLRPVSVIAPPPPGRDEIRAKDEASPERMAKLPWRLFSPADEEFSALMPSPVDRKPGFYDVSSEGVYYMIGSREKPGSAPITSVDKDYALMATSALAAASSLFRFSDENTESEVSLVGKLNLNNYPGIEYRVKQAEYCGKTTLGVLRVYGTDKRIYTVLVLGADGGEARASKFLQSFTIKRKLRPRNLRGGATN